MNLPLPLTTLPAGLLLLLALLASCQSPTRQQEQTVSEKPETPSVSLILDTDIGPDVDDAGALAMLHALADNGEAEILATISCNPGVWSARLIRSMNRHYGRPELPVGEPKGHGVQLENQHDWARKVVEEQPGGAAAVSGEVPSALAIYRQTLAAQPDGSVTIVTIGFLTNLAELLASGPDAHSPLNGEDLVRQKVKELVSMAGKFPRGPEFNLALDPVATVKVINEWPTPILFSGWEIGESIKTGGRVQRELAPENLIRKSYTYYFNQPPDTVRLRASWDQTAVLAAVRGTADYWEYHPGRIVFKPKWQRQAPDHNPTYKEWDENTWQDDPNGTHRYLVEKMPPAQLEQVIEELMLQPPRKAAM
jgi:inosine-uridine nucleoside N-ribohydrolase